MYQYTQIRINRLHFWVCCLLIGTSCSKTNDQTFQAVPASHTGIHFQNTITETEDFNILNFHYIYNGGGVGVGDFNKDGLPDLVFSGNQVDSKLYLNQGNLRFEDISEAAQFQVDAWATGVSIIDLNSDGWQDIYISVGGLDCSKNCKNKLFIHQGLNENGIPIFKEAAAKYNLADEGRYTQQAAFFDFDSDGDLDVYLLHNVIDRRDKNAPSPKRFINELSEDKLLKNEGGTFIDVSEAMGIAHRGYGLGITINDFNKDGLPDIYVANDFLSNDLLYLNKNKKDETPLGFQEASQQYLKHQTYNSMGVDVADINNDALADILVLDMLPAYHERQKTMQGFMNYNKFLLSLRENYAPQFVRNTLQVHNGFLQDSMLAFSEMGYLAGIYNTDWSWTPLLADFDNDGDRDLYVTNGYGKDITDLDFINYSTQVNTFGTVSDVQTRLFEAVQQMKPVTMPNFIFENKGDFKFQNRSKDWTAQSNSISNGAVYSDLDKDGDLDIVINNIDQAAFLLENKSPPNNYLKIKLEGSPQNPSGIGASISIWANGTQQTHYQSPVRGYLSTVDDVLHFGVAKATQIDSIQVAWQEAVHSKTQNIEVNQTITISIKNAKKNNSTVAKKATSLFQTQNQLAYKHKENQYYDFDAQALLLHQHSRQGPCIISGNINNTAGEELFIGGAKGTASQLIYQDKVRKYMRKAFPDSLNEVVDACFFDADKDGDLDLYTVCGGTAFKADSPLLQDRLYWNDGNANFTEAINVLPQAYVSGGCVAPSDFDKDGDIDLFVGGRIVPRNYPNAPTSQLLLNDNGVFTNQTPDFLAQLGMVSDATWQDIDADGWEDLIVVGEWMPIYILKNKAGILQAPQAIPNSTGLWNCIEAHDFDKDGDIDFMLGNLGKNSRLQASEKQPIALYTQDFDKNGSPDPLVGHYYKNKTGTEQLYPLHARDDVMKQIVKLKNKYLKYADFAKATFQDLTNTTGIDNHYLATCLTSTYLKNTGDGSFELYPFPTLAQSAPIQGILADDFDKDGHLDALLVGNDYTAEKNGGWYDAFNGLFLKGKGDGTYDAIPSAASGFYVAGDGRTVVSFLDKDEKKHIIVGQNEGETLMFSF